MGFLRSLKPSVAAAEVGGAVDRVTASWTGVTDPTTLPITSPWSSNDLQRIVFEDVFGSDIPSNTRSAAMSVPSLARARNLVVSAVARFPLVTKDSDQVLAPVPWLTDAGNTPHQQRMAWTVDDLVFYGWSLWWRSNDPETGFPVAAGRINQGDWQINGDNRIEVHGTPVADSDVILIPGLHEGILSFGRDAIGDARTLLANVRKRLASPIPPIDLHQTGGRDLTPTERADLIASWVAARQSANGAVGYTSQHIEARELGGAGDQLLIEERNAAAVEMARIVGVHAGMVDATTPKASLNYETQSGRNQEFVDLDLALYMLPITARLSMDDVTPPGTHVAFDLSDYTAVPPSPTGPALED